MWPTNQVYKDFATAQTRTPVPIVLVNSIEIDIISIEFKEPRETFVGGFSSKYIVLEVDRDAYVGTYYDAEIEPYIQFKGDLTKVPIGKFYVDKEDVEFDEVQKKYTITAYDSAIKFDKQYEPMKWPMKGKELINGICQSVGVEFDSASIPNIPFYEKSLRGINVNEKELISYRQVINEFARLNFCSVHINRLGQLEFKNVFMNQISETITGYDYKDLKLDKEVKPFNSLVYEQKDINDPVFIKNQENIDEFGLTELKMTDNIFVDVMDKNQQQVYVNEMFQFVSGFTYHKFESNLIMRPDYDGCDLIEYEDMDGNRFKTILTNISWSWVNGGLQGSMNCPQLPETITKYELAGERQDLLNMGIDVDRANNKITSLIQDVGDRTDKETSLTQDVDSINIKVNSLDVGSNLIPNLNALLPMVDETHTGWKFDDKPIFEVEEDLRSLSKHKKVFNHKGTAETSKAFIVPDSVYSYRMKRLETNLIQNGWDGFVPYGSGENFVDNWNFEYDDISNWNDNYAKMNVQKNTLRCDYFRQELNGVKVVSNKVNVGEFRGNAMFRIKYRTNIPHMAMAWAGISVINQPMTSEEWEIIEVPINVTSNEITMRFYADDEIRYEGKFLEIDWIQLSPIDDQHLVVEKTPLDNGLTHIQTWGGNHIIKLVHYMELNLNETTFTTNIDNSDKSKVKVLRNNPYSHKIVEIGQNTNIEITDTDLENRASNYAIAAITINENLDFIASEPVLTTTNQDTLKVYVKEFNSEEVLIKSTPFYLEGTNIIETITFQPIAETSYVSLLFENNNDLPLDITEEMFNRGNPAKWEEDSEDLKLWSQAQFNIQNDRITNTVEQVNIFNDDLTERIQGAEDQLSEQEGQIQDVSKEAAAEVTKVRTELISSLEQTAEQQELVFKRIESVQDGQEERLNEMATFYRYDIDGAIVGREGDPMQFYFSNDEASFRNNGERISYWRGKKFYVEELEVLASIIIGQHLIESEGNNTKVRSVN